MIYIIYMFPCCTNVVQIINKFRRNFCIQTFGIVDLPVVHFVVNSFGLWTVDLLSLRTAASGFPEYCAQPFSIIVHVEGLEWTTKLNNKGNEVEY